jgi:cytochrome c peroxidase
MIMPRQLSSYRHLRPAAALCGAAIMFAACEPTSGLTPAVPTSLDGELRQLIAGWGGVMPIGESPVQTAAMVDLGQSLFFDKILSGNRDVSCASCHDPLASLTDGLSLAVGTGGMGTGGSRLPGAGRQFVPRNAPSLLNQGLGFFYILWDGRVNEELGPNGHFKSPAGVVLPPGLNSLLAAQAMFPVLNRVEMRGLAGDLDRDGNTNELAQFADTASAAIWRGVMQRLLAVNAYVAKFNAAYPSVPTSALGFQHAANALAAFQIHAFTKTNSPFDRFLARDDRAMTDEQKRGGIQFFGQARCASCHFGPLLGGQTFANIGVPQLGPGVGAAAPLDIGRAEHISIPGVPNASDFYKFSFRAPALRNVELTAPYMHNGAYRTLETVVRHYTNADSAHRAYDVTQLDPALRSSYRGDATTMNAVLRNLDGRLHVGIRLTATEQAQIVAFLKSLTDPAARNLASVIPTSVPSGLPVRE